jgi:hypothetical protein
MNDFSWNPVYGFTGAMSDDCGLANAHAEARLIIQKNHMQEKHHPCF